MGSAFSIFTSLLLRSYLTRFCIQDDGDDNGAHNGGWQRTL